MHTPTDQTQLRLQSLIEINQLLMSAVEPDEVLAVVLEAALRLFEVEGCSLALLDDTAQELAFVKMVGPAKVEEFRLALGQGIAGWVTQTGQGVVCNDVAQDTRFFQGVDQQTGYSTRSILCAPLKQHDRIIGVIEAINTTRTEGFSAADLDLLTAFGGLAGTAITRTQAFARVRNAGAALQEVIQDRYRLVSGTSPAMREALRLARTVAATNTTVLLLGDSGTGKEVVARAIHQWSPRVDQPFTAVNCVTLTPELLASELFGHERGAFTGATAQKKGKFELADGGTLFLDEIGDLALDLQTKLLRVLQDKEFQRVGGVKDLRVDVRILAATNRDLHQAMQRGAFREDLYYRLNVVPITLPALRDRRPDIPALVHYFLDHYCREVNRPRLGITQEALELLRIYHWPGNVRELQNAIERAVVLSQGSDITAADFPLEIRQAGRPPTNTSSPPQGIDPSLPLAEAVSTFKRAKVLQALEMARGNQSQAAKLLGLQPSNLSRLIHTLGLRVTTPVRGQ
jgi:Nif-specific regulatory protein